MASPYSITRIDSYPSRDGKLKQIPGGVQLVNINSNYYKNWLSNKLGISTADPGAFHLHRETTKEYAQQMTSEYIDDKGLWQAFRQRANHYWDCEVLALAAADFMGVKFMGIPASRQAKETKAKKKVKRKGGRRW